MTTWRTLIENAMKRNGEAFADAVFCTLKDNELDVLFDAGYGNYEGKAFTLWTRDSVYFPTTYDGKSTVASVPRNPCEIATLHVGG
jgi:hypothetical protein